MPYTANDQKQLVDLFGLDREQLKSSSHLKSLMNDQETFDSTNGLTTVADVQSELALVFDAGGIRDKLADVGTAAYSSITRPTEGTIAYRSQGERLAGYRQQISGSKDKIIRLLDPCSGWLESHTRGRALRA